MESKKVREIFIQWEKLRLVYVGILTLVFAYMVINAYLLRAIGRPELSFYKVIIQSSILAMIANALYFAGPILDTYLSWLGLNIKYQTYVIFMAGMALSIILEVILLTIMLSNF